MTDLRTTFVLTTLFAMFAAPAIGILMFVVRF